MTASLAVVRKSAPARPRADLPRPSEAELLERDVRSLIETVVALNKVTSTIDVREIRKAIGLSECLTEDNRLADLRERLEGALKPATRKDIAKALAITLLAFPNAGKLDAAYTRGLAEDVGAQEPSIGALEGACRRVRRTSKFIPTVSEMLEALDECAKRLASAKRWIEGVPEAAEHARAHLAKTLSDLRERDEFIKARIRMELDYQDADEIGTTHPPFVRSYQHWPPRLVDEVRRERGEDVPVRTYEHD